MTDSNRKGQDGDAAFDADFDFSNWGDGVDDASAPAGGKAKPDQGFEGFDGDDPADADDPFADFRVDPADPAPAKGGESFSAQDDDDFFESDELQEMPIPQASAAQGDADDEFADVGGGDGFNGGGDFSTDDDVFAEEGDEPRAAAAYGDDAFDEGQGGDDAGDFSGDEFTSSGDAGTEEAPAAPAKAASGASLVSKLRPLVAVAALAGAGYVGYAFVLPQFLGGDEPIVVASNPPPAPEAFPKGLPGKDGGLPLAGVGAPSGGKVPPISQQPSQAPSQVPGAAPGPLPSQGAQPASPGEFGKPSGGQPQVSLTIPDLSALPAPQPTPHKAPDADDLVGGDRGGISAVPAIQSPAKATAAQPQAPASQPAKESAPSADAQAIERRIASLQGTISSMQGDISSIQREIAALSGRLDGLRPSPSAGVVGAAVEERNPAALPQGVVPPLKPAIVDGVTLSGVSRDVAWVRTAAGVVEVRQGDDIPGAGQFVKLRPYGDGWVLVTTQGIVTR